MQVFNSNIIKSSAATSFRCGGKFSNGFVANCLTSLSAKEFSKSVTL